MSTTNCSNYVADLIALADRRASLQYTSRSIASIAHSIVQQLPKEYEARIDFDRFLSSFSFEVETPPDADVPKENRPRETVGPWDLHPGSTHKSDTLGCTRAESVALWRSHKVSRARYLPYVAGKSIQTQIPSLYIQLKTNSTPKLRIRRRYINRISQVTSHTRTCGWQQARSRFIYICSIA